MTSARITAEQKVALDHARHLAEFGVPVLIAKPARTRDGEWDRSGGSGGTGYHLPEGWQDFEPDPDVLDDWQPGWAVCAVMGHGVDGLDVDPRNGGDDSLAQMQAEGSVPRSYGRQGTPSGGMHDLIASLGVRSKNGVLPGVDVKAGDSDGNGRGFLFIAPTERVSKATGKVRPYEWESPPDLAELLVGADDSGKALATMVRGEKPPVERPEKDFSGPSTPEQVDRAEEIFDSYVRSMRTTTEGSRNDRLIELLPTLYRFVLGGCLDEIEVDERMREAAAEAGIGREYDTVRRSAWVYARKDGPDRPESAADVFGSVPAPVVTSDMLARFQRLDLSNLLDPDRPPREYVVEPMILTGTSVALVAPAGHRKSLLLLGLALAVARGSEDFAGMSIPKARRVLYLDMENTEDDLRERLLSFGVTHGDQLDRLILVNLPSMEPLDTARGGAEFTEAVDAYGLEPGDVVVLDSYQRITQSGENESDTTRGYFRHTGVHLKARGLTVIRTDNTGKDVKRGARGSSGKRDDVDVEYLLESKGDYIEIATGKVRQRDVSELTIWVGTEDDQTIFRSSLRSPTQVKVQECVALLDKLGAPERTGERKAKDILGEHDPDVPTREILRRAVKIRQDRAANAARDFPVDT